MWWRTVGVLVLLLATDAHAGSAALSGEEIKHVVAGAVFEVDTPLGTKLPISYAEDGHMSAEAGGLAYLLGSPTDSGNWWISGNRLCQKWRRWFDGAVHCLRLSQEGTRIFWRRDDGETGTASITSRSERQLAAREIPRQQPARVSEARAFVAPSMLPSRAAVPPSVPPEPEAAGEAPILEARPVEAPKAPAESRPSPAAASAKRPVVARTATEPPVARLPASFRVAGVDLDDVLNVRNGPSPEHDVIGRILPDAAGIKIVGRCVAAWCPIQHRGVSGWVNSFYLSPHER